MRIQIDSTHGWFIAAFSMFLLLAIACSTEDTAPKAVTTICFPSTIIEPHSMTTVFFNGNNQISQIKTEQNPYFYSTLFFYNNQNQRIDSAHFLKTGALFSGLATVVTKGIYTYDIAGRLITTDSTANGAVYRTTYHYNPINQIDKSSLYFIANNAETILYTMTYEYPNTSTHNPSLITSTSGATWKYEYDDKTNPAKLFGFVSIRLDNNVTKLTITQAASTAVYSYSYQYNDMGYPTFMQSGIDETHWSYDCRTTPM